MYKYCHFVCLLFIETLHHVQYLGACRATLELRSLSWDMTHETIKTLRHRPKEPPDQSAWSVPTTLVDHTMERLHTAMNLLAQYCCCDISRTRVVAFKRAGRCLDQSEGGTLTTLSRPDIVFSGLDCWLCLFLNKLAGFNWTTGVCRELWIFFPRSLQCLAYHKQRKRQRLAFFYKSRNKYAFENLHDFCLARRHQRSQISNFKQKWAKKENQKIAEK